MAVRQPRLRDAARRLASSAGALALRHRLRNRDTLTVAMFHRVVEPDTPAAAHADPRYTLAAPLFAALLRWLARHYTVVSLADVLAACTGGAALPSRALLLTFDDGWADNRSVALPLLRAERLPSVVFIATDAVADPAPPWWQEVLLRALREGRANLAALWHAAASTSDPPPANAPELALLRRWAALSPERRTALLAPWRHAEEAAEPRHMLRPEELAELAASGMAVASHGAAHLPLPLLPDPAADLAAAAAALRAWLPAQPAPAFSFPHGRLGPAALAAAWQAGHRLVFTSDACLNAAPAGRPLAPLLGRISLEARGISDAQGNLDPSRLETWMFHRPIRRLDPGPAAMARAA